MRTGVCECQKVLWPRNVLLNRFAKLCAPRHSVRELTPWLGSVASHLHLVKSSLLDPKSPAQSRTAPILRDDVAVKRAEDTVEPRLVGIEGIVG
jgi:hypothetical protein